ncbi:uncharacterized protein I206_102940 [Kwoniella pini CBS 10737]|uniref:Uncharacterized protein n=1 Tax=Kwoniella pini CBS 10737 TaxID=1296096 RepID=A0A1B9I6R3_9TREE|nr:uncharacterized protein I206_03291 [Kwoniella pini CBS 10737]OCF51225.1 hypothetical protein I206_03291 [Kwoniella pini CBS 10737]
MTRDLGERAQDFREQWLAPSGGWLGEIVMIISDSTGVWDLIISSGIFVGSWIILRTSPMEISLILALGFDLSIPLQYYNDEYLSTTHELHLQNYWPTFMIGCIVEGVSFFLLHPDLFTLIVCIKTTFLLIIWLSKDQEGLSIKPRKLAKARRSHKPSPKTPSSDSDSDVSPNKSNKPNKPSSSSPQSNMPKSKYLKNPHKYLKRAGYVDPAIAGMILSLNQLKDKEKAKKQFKAWVREKNPEEIKRRNKQYSERARQAGWKDDSSAKNGDSNSGQVEPIDEEPPNMPTSYFIPTSKAYSELKKAGYEDPAIAGMLIGLNSIDKKTAMKNFKIWTEEKDPNQIKRRNKQHGEIAKQKGYPDKAKMNKSVGGNPYNKLKQKLGIPKMIDILKNPESEEEIIKVINTLKQLGINIQNDVFKDGYMESDGKGGFRDIILKQDDIKNLIQKMRHKEFSKEQMNQWIGYLTQPLSHNEFEENVIPLGKRLNCSIGHGYHGTGPHQFDPAKLNQIKDQIQDKTGVNTSLLDHLILEAINIKDPQKAQDRLNRLARDGITKAEFEKYRKEIDWS